MDKKSKKFLFDYLNNASPTGFEQSGQQIWLDYLKPYINDYMVDVYGTAVGTHAGNVQRRLQQMGEPEQPVAHHL